MSELQDAYNELDRVETDLRRARAEITRLSAELEAARVALQELHDALNSASLPPDADATMLHREFYDWSLSLRDVAAHAIARQALDRHQANQEPTNG